MSRHTLLYIIGVALLLLLTACNRQTVYNHYEHTPVTGWEKNDTLIFYTEPLTATSQYVEEVGVRISGDYPFMSLILIIDQTILPSFETRSDTLTCSLIDERGNAKGYGVSHYQYKFPLMTLPLREGDRLHISVRHDMKREILPGISDVGIKLSRKD